MGIRGFRDVTENPGCGLRPYPGYALSAQLRVVESWTKE